MASETLKKELLLHGIGKGVFKTVNGKVFSIRHAQGMKLNITTSTEDQYGGDSLFPLFTYLTKKEGTIEITNAVFSLAQIAIAQGSENVTSGNKRQMSTTITKGDDSLGSSLTGVEVDAVIDPSGNMITLDTASGGTGLYIDSTGKITDGGSVLDSGEYEVYFKADDTNTVTAKMLKDAMPEVASFNWMFQTEDSDGNKYQIDIFVRRCRANGELAIETARDSASTPTLTVNILDPGDGYSDFADVSVTPISA